MKSSSDPSVHREHERVIIEHATRLLSDPRLRVDTIGGRRGVVSLRRDVRREDREVDLKRAMSEAGVPDRELQSRMPVGQELTATLLRTRWLLFKQIVGRIKVVCLSPTRQLISGEAPAPANLTDIREAMQNRVAKDRMEGVPTTVVLMSTSGFTIEAHGAAERTVERTVILVEPNGAGGWTVTGPADAQGIADLFDPEIDGEKRERIRQAIVDARAELLTGGLAADRLAAGTKLPLQLVEEELRSYAKESGLVARRLEGRTVVFKEGSLPPSAGGVLAGGNDMPFMQRVRALFGRKGEHEKKIALLSERRAQLGLQRDSAYEEMGVLEKKEADLREEFKATDSSITRRRITSQLVQLRKDLERRQQVLGVLNQQVNVISTHLHNLELVQQGQTAALPDSEELANDAAAAEEVLADLQASSEVAGTVGSNMNMGMTDEEASLYAELEAEASGKTPAQQTASEPPRIPRERTATPVEEEPPVAVRPERRRDAEPG